MVPTGGTTRDEHEARERDHKSKTVAARRHRCPWTEMTVTDVAT